MKFRIGDKVRVTAGKDKGKSGEIVKIDPKALKVVVAGVNMYSKHIKPVAGRAGDKIQAERALPLAKIAILNDKGQPDRIGFQVAKDGQKTRIYQKTKTAIKLVEKKK